MQPTFDFKPATWLLVLALTYLAVTGSPLRSSHAPISLGGKHHTDNTSALERLHKETQNNSQYQMRASELEVRESELYIIHAEPLNLIVPASLAAQSLVYFYRTLWLKAREGWAGIDPQDTLSMEIGNLLIVMTSTDPIQWSFIARFATKMMGATALGFTGTYNIHYADQSTARMIVVSLRVIDHITGLEARSDMGIASDHGMLESSKGHDERRSLPSSSWSKSLAKSLIQPRNDGPLSTRLSIQRFHARAILTPVIVVAGYLEDFYDMIATKIETGFYNSVDPLNAVTFQRWDYSLSFFCYHAPIPWDFIQEVAISMSDYPRKGFTPAYEAIYHRIDEFGKEIFVTVTFKLLEEKPPIGGIPGINSR